MLRQVVFQVHTPKKYIRVGPNYEWKDYYTIKTINWQWRPCQQIMTVRGISLMYWLTCTRRIVHFCKFPPKILQHCKNEGRKLSLLASTIVFFQKFVNDDDDNDHTHCVFCTRSSGKMLFLNGYSYIIHPVSQLGTCKLKTCFANELWYDFQSKLKLQKNMRIYSNALFIQMSLKKNWW